MGKIIIEIREQISMFYCPLRFKVVQYEELKNGDRIYYGSRSFEGRNAAEQYKRELERGLNPVQDDSGS